MKDKLLPVYWSKQHGAYISLMAAWVIAVIVTGFTWLQPVALFFLLSGLNLIELLSEKFYRKSKMPERKSFWMFIYASVCSIAGTMLFLFSKNFNIIVLLLASGSAFYLILFKTKRHKSMYAEWFVFVLISISSFIGASDVTLENVTLVIAIMSLFFGSSIFSVKERFGKIGIAPVITYVIISILLILYLMGGSIFGICTAVLILIKTSGSWAYPEKFHKLPIKTIGMLEGVYQAVFIVLFILFYQ